MSDSNSEVTAPLAVGIFTSGGDSSGMNAAVRAAARAGAPAVARFYASQSTHLPRKSTGARLPRVCDP